MLALQLLLTLLCLAWLGVAGALFANLRRTRQLLDVPLDERDHWPRVSLIVPARDEAATLEAATLRKLADGYPDLELVLVDDRSTDGTSELVDRLADADPRVRTVHLNRLPDGWLGKLHALDQGVRAATGEWLLFSDADVHFEPDTVRRAVGFCLRERRDVLAMLPHIRPVSLLLDAALAIFLRLVVLGYRTAAVEDDEHPYGAGSGSFTLVRRRAYDRTPGFRAIRMEVADDLNLGLLLKAAGARCALLDGVGSASVEFYPSLGALFRGAEKNGFAVMGRCSVLLTWLGALGLLLFELAPLLALLLPGPGWLRVTGGIALLLATAATLAATRWNDRPLLPALLWPVGSVLFCAVMFRAGWIGWRLGGLRWRDTLHSTAELRAAAREKAEAFRVLRARRRPDRDPP